MAVTSTVEDMAGRVAVAGAALLALLVGAVAEFQPPAAVARDVSPRQSPLDADYYLVDASGHWAAPRCIGDGRSGARVQPVFVYRKGARNRFPDFEKVLRRSLYLSTGIVERSSGTQRTVRWVHDATCQPSIWAVGVPAGKTYDLVSIRRYLTKHQPRFRSPDRVFTLWVDATTSPYWSGLGGDRWSATWSSSWGFVWADTHEMIHALGAVSGDAPHATGKAHCYDGYDVMCYKDGGPGWRKMVRCAWPGARYRLDCGDDDYFAVDPTPRSWLARHPGANVANSRFLAAVAPRALPSEPPAPTAVVRDTNGVTWQPVPGVRYDVGALDADGSVQWLAQDLSAGGVAIELPDPRTRVFVRAVNDAGYSARVRATSR